MFTVLADKQTVLVTAPSQLPYMSHVTGNMKAEATKSFHLGTLVECVVSSMVQLNLSAKHC